MPIEYSREQLEAVRSEMLRRHPSLSVIGSAILAELISYDIPSRETGARKGEVWVSQQTLADNLGVSRRTISRQMKEVVDSPFISRTTLKKHGDGSVHLHYILNWPALIRATIDYLEAGRPPRLRQSDAAERDNLTLPIDCDKLTQEKTEGETTEVQTTKIDAPPSFHSGVRGVTKGVGRIANPLSGQVQRKSTPEEIAAHRAKLRSVRFGSEPHPAEILQRRT